jgi:hypothetical protein|tara:strand:+ start:675 stop:1229 length:555 start_codon:yes stop_codon:yes gene_type:complete
MINALIIPTLFFNPTPPPAPVEPPEVVYSIGKKIWKCPSCNTNEKKTLNFLQTRGITDNYALATVLGNIKQESNFISNICEGGHRVPYNRCHSGGYGLIQWTSPGRYYGLGRYAKKTGGSPSSIDTQLRYMITEREWKDFEPVLKYSGKSINYYMHYAYGWLGWGIHGNRTQYSYNYLNKLIRS